MKLDYMQRITLGITTAKQNFPTGVCTTEVSHDDKCKIFKNKTCSCVPDIFLTINGAKYQIDDEGVLR